MPHSTNQILFE